MSDVKSYIILFLLIIAFAAGCFWLGNVYAKYTIKTKIETSDTTYINNTITVTDTIKKWYPKIVYKDTLKIEKLDTILISDRDTFKLNLERMEYPEVNYKLGYSFNKSSEIKIINDKVVIEESKKFINNFNMGIGFGYSVIYDNPNFKLQPSINLSVYYNLF